MPTVVITGSSRGFGLEQAKKFRELGYQVAFAGMKEQGFPFMEQRSGQLLILHRHLLRKVRMSQAGKSRWDG